LNADAWEDQMLALASEGYRCIAHDRRGHGRSDQPWQGNDMNTFADDIATLIDTLDLTNVMIVGHSMGGGDVARYIGKYGTSRLSKAVLISAVTPHLLQTPSNPDGVSLSVFDQMRDGMILDRAQFFEDIAKKFFGANKLMSGISQGILHSFAMSASQASLKSVYDCIQEFSETDFTQDLIRFNLPTLIIHGDADQVVPIAASSEKTAKLLPDSTFNIYEGAPHGLCSTHKDLVNQDLLDFARAHSQILVKS
jgi:non-heme chloroperoxidase